MTTEQRTGFRLPWSSDRSPASDAPAEDEAGDEGGAEEAAQEAAAAMTEVEPGSGAVGGETDKAPAETGGRLAAVEASLEGPSAIAWPETDTPAAAAARASRAESSANDEDKHEESEADAMSKAQAEPTTVAAPAAAPRAAPAPAAPPAGPASSRPMRLLEEMSRAMQAAAQAARDETVARMAAESKEKIEEIQAQGSTGTTELRRRADDDVAASREWSKAEIARIREETEHRIADRKAQLEADVERHAASIKRRTELVREAVARHEADLAAFIERLMAEGDPTRIATLAQEVPEPPALDDLVVDEDAIDRDAEMPAAKQGGRGGPGPRAVTRVAPAGDLDGDSLDEDAGDDGLAALRTSARDSDEAADDAAGAGADEAEGDESEMSDDAAAAPRTWAADEPSLSAAGAAAAEAEALSGLDGDDPARIRLDRSAVPAGGMGRTELLVSGLGSVAGIAGFKRELSRLPGVRSVGVSAGEAGRFVFAVSHDTGVDMTAEIPTIARFGAQLTGRRTGTLLVSASEPTTAD